MEGQIARGIWKVVDRFKEKTVLGMRTVFKRKLGKDGHIKKYNSHFVAQESRQIKGLHYD